MQYKRKKDQYHAAKGLKNNLQNDYLASMDFSMLLHFFIALAASFIGYLPFGTVNLSVIDATINQGLKAALIMAIGASLIEIIHSFISLNFSMLITEHIEKNIYIKVGVVVLFIMLGLLFWFRKSGNNQKKSRKYKVGPFEKGAFLSVINPQALPFWVFVIAYFQSVNVVQFSFFNIIGFLMGVSVGRFLSLLVWAYLSQIIARRVKTIGLWINKIIGGILIAIGIFQGILLVI